MAISLRTPLTKLPGVGAKLSKPLLRLGIVNVRDLLWHFPTRYEDYGDLLPIDQLEPGTQVTIEAEVTEISSRRSWKQRKLTITEMSLEDETGSLSVTWFNQPYIEKQMPVGTSGYFAGTVAVRNGELTLTKPSFEPKSEIQKHTGRLIPIYPSTRGITSRGIRYMMLPLLEELTSVPDPLPKKIAQDAGYPERLDALHQIHFPSSLEEAESARERFVFEELFLLQLSNFVEQRILGASPAIPIPHDLGKIKRLVGAFPFTLTHSQKAVFWDVLQDIEKPHPMNRLVQGDVGSGKTVIAIAASVVTAEAELQTAIMAPTEVLARQHYETYKKAREWFSELETFPTTALLTGSQAKVIYEEGLELDTTPEKVREMITRGEIEVIIGTHALISGKTSFSKLGLVVIDEQHRFGVAQRQALASSDGALPHFLSMSATPIPRTVMLTALGDLHSSRITELPGGRAPITTLVVNPGERKDIYRAIQKEITAGRQAFFVCPLIEQIEDDEALSPAARMKRKALADVQSVTQVADNLEQKIFPDLRIARLHGKMKPKEKEEIMRDFEEKKYDILVATTVIEVGIDVPNATIMAIESVERFGLAQLYQLRGRVGRGEHPGTCYLFTEQKSPSTEKRVKALIQARNGFELAEYDLLLRGPGEFLGKSQTGMPDLAMKHLNDKELVQKSRDAAEKVLEKNEGLPKSIERLVGQFRKRVHRE